MRLLTTLIASLGCLTLVWHAPVLAAAPNIILCMGDDHGWEETGYNGHPHLKTPILDEMAASGLRLDNFYAGHPSCSPTRVSVLTGRHPNRCGTFAPGWSIRPEEITVAHLLRKAGYRCGHFGKWHVGPVKAESPTNPGAMGFHEWVSHDNFFELNPSLSRNGGPPKRYEGESSEIIIDEAIRFIGDAKEKEKPFLAVVWFGSPHEPYSGPAKDLALYDDLLKEYQGRSVTLTSNETGNPTRRQLGKVLRERYAEITAMDRAIGKLRDFLKAEDLRENTLLWYCGDNGTPPSGHASSPLRGIKATMYEGGIRVPGLIEWPARIKMARRSSINTVTSDMLPTACALAEQPLPKRPLDGINLVPLIDGEMTERSHPICFWHFNTQGEGKGVPYIEPKLQQGTTPLVKRLGGLLTRNFTNFHHPDITEEDYTGPRAIVGNRYKMVINGGTKDESTRELFDLRVDKGETKNMADTHPEIVQKMEQELRAWQEAVLQSLMEADYPKE